jgi:BCD family chlorophyll transporter-like MFS transporter
MASRDLPVPPPPAEDVPSHLPRLSLFTMFRLGLVQMGLGIMAILMLGVLNRVMIQELAIPATIVGGSIAMYQLVAPARILFGQMTDSRTFLGYHRTSYIWLGSGLFAVMAFVAVQVVWQLNRSAEATGWSGTTYGWVAILALAFAVYGLCISATSTPFFALMVDVSDEDTRGKLVGIVWSMLTLGVGGGAGLSAGLLRGITDETLQGQINQLFIVVPGIVFLLVIAATWGVEKKYSRLPYRRRNQGNNRITFREGIAILTASRQTGYFFTFLVMLILGMFMQQPILEPFGGEVFGMSLSQTTALNIFWSLGSLVSLSLTGFWLVPKFGKKPVAKWGCLAIAVCFLLLPLTGFLGQVWLLQFALVLFGLALGVATGSSISLMLDLTTAETAGTFTGLWGLAQAFSQAGSSFLGGALLDLGRQAFGVPIFAYGFVFYVEAAALVIAVILLRRVDVAEFRTQAGKAVQVAMEGDLS